MIREKATKHIPEVFSYNDPITAGFEEVQHTFYHHTSVADTP